MSEDGRMQCILCTRANVVLTLPRLKSCTDRRIDNNVVNSRGFPSKLTLCSVFSVFHNMFGFSGLRMA